MDPVTAFVLGMFLMLAIGAFLGFVHDELPASVQPAAKTWRIANLIGAGGVLLVAATAALSLTIFTPISNGILIAALAGFVVAICQFYGRAAPRWLILPCILAPILLYWFAGPRPDLTMRIIIVSIAVPIILMTGFAVVNAERKRKPSKAALILMSTFAVTSSIFAVRGVVFALNGVQTTSIVDASHWTNTATAIVIILTPIICTVAFLLMCTERVTQQWRTAATTDYLTGLPNRRLFVSDVNTMLAEAASSIAVAIVDVDHFKRINDEYGHDVGDLALKAVAEALRSAVRINDLCSRLGGEEFALAFGVDDPTTALELAERVRRQIENATFAVGGEAKHLTVSIGIAFRAKGDTDATLDSLLLAADKALYLAKSRGRNRVVLAGESQPLPV